jgi:hypothetical protein
MSIWYEGEGVMRRANITKQVDEASLVLEYDEEYDAGSGARRSARPS